MTDSVPSGPRRPWPQEYGSSTVVRLRSKRKTFGPRWGVTWCGPFGTALSLWFKSFGLTKSTGHARVPQALGVLAQNTMALADAAMGPGLRPAWSHKHPICGSLCLFGSRRSRITEVGPRFARPPIWGEAAKRCT